MGAQTGDNAKHDDHQNPAISFILMNDLVTKERDEKRYDGDKNDTDCEGTFTLRDV